jgi:hypothetical protein
MRFYCAAILILSLSLSAFALSALAATGEGTVSGKAQTTAGFLEGNVRAFQLDGPTPIVSRQISRNGKYTLSLPPGRFALVSSVFGKRGPVRKIAFATVKKGKKATPRSPVVRKALNANSETRISVGNVLARGPQGQTYRSVDGRPVTFDDILITDLFLAPKTCSVAVVEDRKFGRFQDVLKELKRQSSALFAEPINFKAATKILNANAPQFRITGSIGVIDSTFEASGSASIQIVDLKTGSVLLSQELSGLPTGLDTLFPAIAERVLSALCIPQRIRGTFVGSQQITDSGVSVRYDWQGSATLVLQGRIPADPSQPSRLNVALYGIESFQIDSYRKSGVLGNCQVSVEAGVTEPLPPSTGFMLVYLDPVAGQGYRYDLSVIMLNQEGATQVRTCPDGGDTSPHEVTAELAVSLDANQLPFAPSLTSYAGAYEAQLSTGITTMSWNFVGGP